MDVLPNDCLNEILNKIETDDYLSYLVLNKRINKLAYKCFMSRPFKFVYKRQIELYGMNIINLNSATGNNIYITKHQDFGNRVNFTLTSDIFKAKNKVIYDQLELTINKKIENFLRISKERHNKCYHVSCITSYITLIPEKEFQKYKGKNIIYYNDGAMLNRIGRGWRFENEETGYIEYY